MRLGRTTMNLSHGPIGFSTMVLRNYSSDTEESEAEPEKKVKSSYVIGFDPTAVRNP